MNNTKDIKEHKKSDYNSADVVTVIVHDDIGTTKPPSAVSRNGMKKRSRMYVLKRFAKRQLTWNMDC